MDLPHRDGRSTRCAKVERRAAADTIVIETVGHDARSRLAIHSLCAESVTPNRRLDSFTTRGPSPADMSRRAVRIEMFASRAHSLRRKTCESFTMIGSATGA
jgi:hypothetical protein